MSLQKKTIKKIEELENLLCQSSQFAQSMIQDKMLGRSRPWTLDDAEKTERNIDKCWVLLQKIKKLVQKW